MIQKLLLTSIIFTSSVYSMQISPIKIYLNKKNKVQNLNITNNTNKEKIYQSKLFKWEMNKNGKTKLIPTTPKEIIAMPLIFKLKPHQTKAIKIGKMIIKPNKIENYRIIVKDITPSKKNGISIKIASSIPIFPGQEYSKNDKDFIKSDFKIDNNKNKIIITIKNNSSIFQELSEIEFNNKIKKELHHYILPKHNLTIELNKNKIVYKTYRLKFLNGIEINKNIN